jgi:hypothetical protein
MFKYHADTGLKNVAGVFGKIFLEHQKESALDFLGKQSVGRHVLPKTEVAAP